MKKSPFTSRPGAQKSTKLRIVCFSLLMLAMHASANDYVLRGGDAPTAAIGEGYSRIVKQGDGEAVLSVDSPAFTGTVVVEKGTLTIASRDAVGSAPTIEVLSGATLMLKTPKPSGTNNDPCFTGHEIIIAGDGVDGMGAFRYAPQGGGDKLSDNLISALTLSADATIEVGTRWGFGQNARLTLNGHTLTRKGTEYWTFTKTTISSGYILNTEGWIYFSRYNTYTGSDSDGGLVMQGGNVGIYRLGDGKSGEEKKFSLPITFTGDNTYVKVDNSNGGMTENVFSGPVAFNGSTAHNLKGKNQNLSFDGSLTVPSASFTINEGLWVNFNHDMTIGQSGLTIQKNSLVAFSGDHERTIAGTLVDKGTLLVDGGEVVVGGQNDIHYVGGSTSGSRGCLYLKNGSLTFSNDVCIAAGNSSFGSYFQTGGNCELLKGSDLTKHAASYLGGRTYGTATGAKVLYYQGGGTNNLVANNRAINDNISTYIAQGGGDAVVTLSGTGTLFKTEGLLVGSQNKGETTLLNVNRGATLAASRLMKNYVSKDKYYYPVGQTSKYVWTYTPSANNLFYVNVNGGVLKPTWGYAWTGINQDTENIYRQEQINSSYADLSPTKIIIYENGLTFDVSESYFNRSNPAAGGDPQLMLTIEDAFGFGLESVVLPEGITENYTAPAVISIEGDGFGASAFVDYDFATKKLSNVVVTSAGCGYTKENTKVYLLGADNATKHECPDFTLRENVPGSLTMKGPGTVTLGGSRGDWSGGTIVDGARLVPAAVDSIPQNTDYTIINGGELVLKGALSAKSFGGTEGTVSGAAVTITDALRVKCSDVWNKDALVFDKALTFADGAKIVVEDSDELKAFKNNGNGVVVRSNAGIIGTPELVGADGTKESVGAWRLIMRNNRVQLGFSKGTTIIVR